MWIHWEEAFNQWVAAGRDVASAFHTERIGNERWRLTAYGVKARDCAGMGNGLSQVIDCVLTRGFFDGSPQTFRGMPVRHEPAPGHGRFENLTLVYPGVGPTGQANTSRTSIVNWAEGVQAFAAAWTGSARPHTPQAPTPGEVATPNADAGDPPAPEHSPNDEGEGVAMPPRPDVTTPVGQRNVRQPKPLTPPEARIVAAWESGEHKSYKAVADALSLGARGDRTVRKLVDRVSKQKKRKGPTDN